MTVELTEADLALLRETQLAHVATVSSRGTLQVTPVWIDTDGEAVVFNTAKGRVKHRNLLRNPQVAISVADRTNDQRWLSVQGRAEFIDEGAAEHINALAHKYRGTDYPFRDGEERVKIRVVPESRVGNT